MPIHSPVLLLSLSCFRGDSNIVVTGSSDLDLRFLSLLFSCPGHNEISTPCLSSIILSPLNGNVKMSPYETGDIHVESEGTAASERHYCLRQRRHGVCQRRRTPGPERAPD